MYVHSYAPRVFRSALAVHYETMEELTQRLSQQLRETTHKHQVRSDLKECYNGVCVVLKWGEGV